MNMTQDRLQGVGKEMAGERREVSKTLADLTKEAGLYPAGPTELDRKQAAWPDFCPRKIISGRRVRMYTEERSRIGSRLSQKHM